MLEVKAEYNPDVLSYIPPVYANIKEFQAMAKAYNIELKEIENRALSIESNAFIDMLDEYGCTKWEKILNLKIDSSYTLDDRRFNIQTKLFGFLPYTLKKIENMIKNLVGESGYTLNFNPKTMHIHCRLNLGIKNQLKSVENLLENTIPMNISLDVQLLFNTHQMLKKYSHNEMRRYTHKQLREESGI